MHAMCRKRQQPLGIPPKSLGAGTTGSQILLLTQIKCKVNVKLIFSRVAWLRRNFSFKAPAMSPDLAIGISAITGLSVLAYRVGRHASLKAGRARQTGFVVAPSVHSYSRGRWRGGLNGLDSCRSLRSCFGRI